MGRGWTVRRRVHRPARDRPDRKRDTNVKGSSLVWLLTGLLQGLMPRLGQLAADAAWPWLIRAIGWAAGLVLGWLASELGCLGLC